MIKKLRRKIAAFVTLFIGIFAVAFSIGASAYFIKKYERGLYSALDNAISASERKEAGGADGGKTEIGALPPGEIAPTGVCVVKCSLSEDGEMQIETLSEDFCLAENVLENAVTDAIGAAGVTLKVYEKPPQTEEPQPPQGADNKPAEPNEPNEPNEPKNGGKKQGVLKAYKLVYSVKNGADGARVAFADYAYLKSVRTRVITLAAAFDVSLIALTFLLALYVSAQAVKPVEKADEEQKRFIADASHELKTPLAVIAANNKILLSETAAPCNEKQREWLLSSQEEIGAMTEIIRDMLALAQGEALTKAEKRPLDISYLAGGICLQFDAAAYEKGVALQTEIERGASVNGDEKMLKRLLSVLIENAIKYEPEGGLVRVKLYTQGGAKNSGAKNGGLKNGAKGNPKVVFEVKNERSEIAPEDLPHIFERFYRADKSRASGDGVGLGLAIAKNIADLHGARLTAESSPAAGTTFKVEF